VEFPDSVYGRDYVLTMLKRCQPLMLEVKLKRLAYAYIIGFAACAISISLANRHDGRHFSLLFALLLGISSSMPGKGLVPVHMLLAAALLPSVFVLAEILRSKASWIRWLGYGAWILLAAASLLWFPPPNI
jgi:hypothetical protein